MSEVRGLYSRFTPPGPVAAGWLQSEAPMSFIMGPVGSAKTTTGAMKCLNVTKRQHPSTIDGRRKAVVCAMRMNYRQMHKTLIPTWLKVFPASLGKWEYEKDGPCTHTIMLNDPIYGVLELVVWFRSVGDHDIDDFTRGLEVTAWWLNEVDEMPPDCLGMLLQRTGRAFIDEKPDAEVLAPVKYCRVFGDLNAPDEDNWFNEGYILDTPPDAEFYVQPSGFDPEAENLSVLHRDDPNYYETRAAQYRHEGREWAIRRFLENKTGYSRQGEPVYEDFGQAHIAEEGLSAHPGGRMIIGVDNGLWPAAVFAQSAGPFFLVLDEDVQEQGRAISAEDFGRRVGRKMVNDYPAFVRPGGFELAFDPACNQRGTDLNTFAIQFQKGFLEVVGMAPLVAAASNDLQRRVGTVAAICQEFVKGKPALRVSRRAKMILRGFMGGYRWVRKRNTQGVFQDKPDKNEYSHPHDALQYAAQRHRPTGALGAVPGRASVHDMRARQGNGLRTVPVIVSDNDVRGVA